MSQATALNAITCGDATSPQVSPVKLNLGCGKNVKPGWVNVDLRPGPGISIVADLNQCRVKPLPLADNSVDEFLLSHIIEHIPDTLALMEELHRIAKPNARAIIRVPYGSSDDAHEDPTHVRAYFLQSFSYFGQPFFWKADYQFRGDWAVEDIILRPNSQYWGLLDKEFMVKVHHERNAVAEMIGFLRAVKPIRQADRALQTAPVISILRE